MEKCKHEGYSGDTWSMRKVRCKFKASTPAGYCKRHDPELIKEKMDKRKAKWDKEYRLREQASRIRDKELDALEVVKRIATGVEDPIETARVFIRELEAMLREVNDGK